MKNLVACRAAARGAGDAAVREAFRPHLARISTIISDAAATGRLATDNIVWCAHADIVKGIVATFPELVDSHFVRNELGPLVRHDEPNMASERRLPRRS